MLLGYSIVDGESLKSNSANGQGGTFAALDPTTGATLEPAYHYASLEDVDHAADLADEAYLTYSKLPGKEKGKFLRHVAAGLEGIGAELVDRAHKETALPEARLKGELARTVGQLRLFAQVVEEGSWVNARIDPAEPERKPMPRADIRAVLRPLGPIAVFGSSNFPLAFSVAGGDTASALAGGRKSGDCEGALRAPRNQRACRPGGDAERERVRIARRRLCGALRAGSQDGRGAGQASQGERRGLYGIA